MSRELELLEEIRDLLQIIAEPQLAKRDAKLRSSLVDSVGGSEKKAKAVQLMDGSRSQSAVAKESGMDPGNLSRLVKSLVVAKLIEGDEKKPKLVLKVPPDLFQRNNEND